MSRKHERTPNSTWRKPKWMALLWGMAPLSWPLEERETIPKWLKVGGVQAEGAACHEDLEAEENMEHMSKKQGEESKTRLSQQSLAVRWRMD